MTKSYKYVGPNSLAHLATSNTPRCRIDSPADVIRWIKESDQQLEHGQIIFATFIVSPSLELWIADRQSEHIACARGGPVASAGEMMFDLTEDVAVEYVTNQSTGFCPEPSSWPSVKASLQRACLEAPEGFSVAFDFRRCLKCKTINIIKDGIFECSVCESELPAIWNLR